MLAMKKVQRLQLGSETPLGPLGTPQDSGAFIITIPMSPVLVIEDSFAPTPPQTSGHVLMETRAHVDIPSNFLLLLGACSACLLLSLANSSSPGFSCVGIEG